jgi:uncharacterized protein (DUF433 family)
MPSVVMKTFKENVMFDPDGEAVAWHPRPEIAPNVIVHPKFSFGQPILERSHIPTAAIAKAVEVEGSARFVADIFEVPEKYVRQAVHFERDLRKAA